MVDLALRGVSPDLTASGECEWLFSLPAGSSSPARARLTGDWLEISAPVQELVLRRGWDPWTLLQLNSRLDGPVRLGVDTNLSCWLRADMALGLEGVGDLCGRLRSAIAVLTDGAAHRSEAPGAHAISLDEAAQLAEEAGWSCARRDRTVEVALDGGRFTHRARMGITPDGRLQTRVPLESAVGFTPPVRAACGLLLLRASASLRAVKGIISEDDGEQVVSVAAASETPRAAADIDRLLTALGVASGLVSREVHALKDEGVAQEYLAHVNHTSAKEEEPCLQLL